MTEWMERLNNNETTERRVGVGPASSVLLLLHYMWICFEVKVINLILSLPHPTEWSRWSLTPTGNSLNLSMIHHLEVIRSDKPILVLSIYPPYVIAGTNFTSCGV